VQTTQWYHRANHSIFGMVVVDAYNLAVGCQGKSNHNGGFHFFLEELIDDLINNKFDQHILRKRREEALKQESSLTGLPVPVLDPHRQWTGPTPTKHRKANKPEYRLQGASMVCKKPTTHVSRSCQCFFKNGPKDKQYWICNKKAGKECMGKHILATHTECIGV
jgi:hypothetical protein